MNLKNLPLEAVFAPAQVSAPNSEAKLMVVLHGRGDAWSAFDSSSQLFIFTSA
jgi:hypothetical protein